MDSDEIPGIGQYEDFHTIDWQRDIARDRMRHRYIVKRKQKSICDLVRGAHDAWSGWLCVLLVGLVTGGVAGVIDIGKENSLLSSSFSSSHLFIPFRGKFKLFLCENIRSQRVLTDKKNRFYQDYSPPNQLICSHFNMLISVQVIRHFH